MQFAISKFVKADTSTNHVDDDTEITVVTKTVIRLALYSKCVEEYGRIRGEVAGARDVAQLRSL